MKSLVFTIGLFFCMQNAVASKGGVTSGGGSLVMNNGKLEPADIHYSAPDESIPNSYIKVDFKRYASATTALQDILRILKMRSHEDLQSSNTKKFSEWNLENTEFYFVPELSGADSLTLSGGYTPVQVSYTREIIDVSGKNHPARDIVELKKELFDQLSPENQGLILTHELMHHKPYGQHSLISPLIRSLSVLLPLKYRQDRGDRSQVVGPEMKESENLLTVMTAVMPENQSAIRKISKNGGGVLESSNLYPSMPEEYANFVSVGSLMSGDGVATGNTLLDSQISFDGKKIINNKFTGTLISKLLISPTCIEVKDNQFTNVEVTYLSVACSEHKSGFKILSKNNFSNLSIEGWGIGDNRQDRARNLSENNINMAKLKDLFLHGGKNKIENVGFNKGGGKGSLSLVVPEGLVSARDIFTNNQLGEPDGNIQLTLGRLAAIEDVNLFGRLYLDLEEGAQFNHSSAKGIPNPENDQKCSIRIARDKTVVDPLECTNL